MKIPSIRIIAGAVPFSAAQTRLQKIDAMRLAQQKKINDNKKRSPFVKLGPLNNHAKMGVKK